MTACEAAFGVYGDGNASLKECKMVELELGLDRLGMRTK